MRRRAWLVGAALATLSAAGARAAEPPAPLVAQVRQRLADAPVLRGRFEQRRQLKGFRNPLVSRGDFLVARERGVLWHTREPFESTLAMTREHLLSRQSDGRVDSRLEAREEPGLRAVNEMLFALMSADLQTLARQFRVEGELQGADAWRLQLVPRDTALARWLLRVELEGDRYVRAVRLLEAQGDSTQIRFTEQASAGALTPDEAARLE